MVAVITPGPASMKNPAPVGSSGAGAGWITILSKVGP